MNKSFFVLAVACFLSSCATNSSLSPINGKANKNVVLDTDYLKSMPRKLTIEDKAVNLLNQLFNTDDANNRMVLVISNDSDCDFTMDILGNSHYTLPVAARKSESIIVERGGYEMKSQVCQGQYKVYKTFSENTQLSIKYSVVTTQDIASTSVATNQ